MRTGIYWPVLPGFGTVHTLITLRFGRSQYSQYFGHQYSSTLSTLTTICVRVFICVIFMLPRAPRNIIFRGYLVYIYIILYVYISYLYAEPHPAGHKVCWRNLDLTQRFVFLRLRQIHWTDRPTLRLGINVHLRVLYFSYYCRIDPTLFVKTVYVVHPKENVRVLFPLLMVGGYSYYFWTGVPDFIRVSLRFFATALGTQVSRGFL